MKTNETFSDNVSTTKVERLAQIVYIILLSNIIHQIFCSTTKNIIFTNDIRLLFNQLNLNNSKTKEKSILFNQYVRNYEKCSQIIGSTLYLADIDQNLSSSPATTASLSEVDTEVIQYLIILSLPTSNQRGRKRSCLRVFAHLTYTVLRPYFTVRKQS